MLESQRLKSWRVMSWVTVALIFLVVLLPSLHPVRRNRTRKTACHWMVWRQCQSARNPRVMRYWVTVARLVPRTATAPLVCRAPRNWNKKAVRGSAYMVWRWTDRTGLAIRRRNWPVSKTLVQIVKRRAAKLSASLLLCPVLMPQTKTRLSFQPQTVSRITWPVWVYQVFRLLRS